jgi:hypothetical protein
MKLLPSLSTRFLPLALACIGLTVGARAQTILPDATSGQPYSFQLTTNPPQPAGTTYAADSLPSGLSIDSSTGIISGVTGAVGLAKGTLSLTSNSATTLYPYQITVDPAASAPTLTSAGGASGTVGTPFLYTITATNNPTSYNIAQLPPGLTASGAQISGTPTTAGLFFTSISANNGSGQGAVVVLFFTINPAGPIPSLTSAALVSSPAGAAFSYAITATNSPTSFSATGLPAGLSLDSTTGIISGTPAAPQVATVVLTASNSYGSSLPRNLVLTIGDFSTITSAASVTGTANSSLSYSLTASNSPVTYNVTGLPAGLSINATTGAITGTPSTAGSYTVTASANNALGIGPSTNITFDVDDTSGNAPLIAPQILAAPAPLSATVGSSVQFSVTAAGSGTLGYQWSLNNIPISGATAPTLTLYLVNASDAGSYTVLVANAQGAVVSAPAVLTIQSLFVPPFITADPSKTSATAGSPASFTVGASGNGPLTYQWLMNGSPIAGATAATLTLPAVQTSDAGTYSVTVGNAAGSVTSMGAVLSVFAEAFAPIFQYQPSTTTVTTGGTATLAVGIVGSPPITYQWSEGGVAIPGATSSSLTFSPVTAADAGVYSVVISDSAGTVTSMDAALTVDPAGGAPVPVSIAVQPIPVSTTVGGSATFVVAANGDASITYQWRKNQAPIAGATSPTFTISDVQASDTGTYDVEVANGFSADVSFPTPLVVLQSGAPSRLVNVSVRGFSGTGPQALAIGFVVGGTGAESALVRAVGPTLSDFGVTGLLADPQLTLFSQGSVLASNDNWGGTASLTAAFAQAGAFPLPPASLDSALLASLEPGAYSAQVAGAGGGTGVVLLEMYDTDISPSPTARFVNVSARGLAGSGANELTVGFVVDGGSSETILIRGIGPTLSEFSVAGALSATQLTVYDSNQNVVASNSGWGGSLALQAVFNSVSAFDLPPTSGDSAVVVTLAPGAYTAVVSGANGSTGIALLEVYEMPQ